MSTETPLMKAAREAEERRRSIIKLAKSTIEKEGKLEIDSDAELSEGSDNGCYVQAWAWLPFTQTEFDKEGAIEAPPPEKPKQINAVKHLFKTDKTLAAVAQATSTDKTRAILNAVFIDQRQAIATDGRILLSLPYAGAIPDGSIIPTVFQVMGG